LREILIIAELFIDHMELCDCGNDPVFARRDGRLRVKESHQPQVQSQFLAAGHFERLAVLG
jgi:hypothetical protein